jgi:hypothetical protein
MSSIKKSFAAIIRKLFHGGKKARRQRKQSSDGTFDRAAERRLQRHLQTARRRDSQPLSFSRNRKSNEEYLQQIEGSLAV